MLPSFIFMKTCSPLIFRSLRHLADSAGRPARLALLLTGMSCMAATIGPLSPTYSTADAGRIDIRQLPVAFEAIDQDAASPRYRARFPNYDVFLDSNAISVRLYESTIRSLRGLNRPSSPNTATLKLSFHGRNKRSLPVGNARLPGKAHYFIGDDPKKWSKGLPLYGSVLYPDVYPGVDFLFQNNNGRLGYRIELDHGGAVHQIALRFSGHDGILLNAYGEIEISTAVGLAPWTAPKAFWETAQGLIRAEATYAIRDDGSVGFEIEGPIRPDPLIIDPDLVFSTFIGGSLGDFINGLALAENGNIVVTGATNSLDFPRSANAAQSNNAGFLDIFVTMLRPDASEIVFSTYLGGQSLDAPNGIVIMADGSISICGFTGSLDFPTSLNAIPADNNVLPDAFVSQLSESGDTLRFSSYVGGSSDDNCTSMVVDGQNRVLITGYTASTDFPITPSAMSTQHQGGRRTDEVFDVLEYDGFFSVLQLDQPSIAYSTFVGGSGSELQVVQFVGPEVEGLAFELGPWLTIDDEGGVYLAGTTPLLPLISWPPFGAAPALSSSNWLPRATRWSHQPCLTATGWTLRCPSRFHEMARSLSGVSRRLQIFPCRAVPSSLYLAVVRTMDFSRSWIVIFRCLSMAPTSAEGASTPSLLMLPPKIGFTLAALHRQATCHLRKERCSPALQEY